MRAKGRIGSIVSIPYYHADWYVAQGFDMDAAGRLVRAVAGQAVSLPALATAGDAPTDERASSWG